MKSRFAETDEVPVVAEAVTGPDELATGRVLGPSPALHGHTDTPVADAWMSIDEFAQEVPHVNKVAFAGFKHSVRLGKSHRYRGEWRRMLNQWLSEAGFQL